MFFNSKKIILASQSSSRTTIFKNNKINFKKIKPICDEEKIKKICLKKNIPLYKISLILAKTKAQNIGKKEKNKLVVGSDTIIEFNNKIIKKAKTIKEAKEKIKKLSGKKHRIYSSAAAYYNEKLVWEKTQKTTIKMRPLTKSEINKYIKSTNKNILNSVGCFQIEKDGPKIIENIKGDFFNVMGFPLFPFLLFLKKFNMKK